MMFLIRTLMEDELCGLMNWLFVLIANRGLCAGLYWADLLLRCITRWGDPSNPAP